MGGASGDVLRITGFPSSPGGINLASKYITNACTHSMCEKEQWREGTQGMCEKEQWRERLTAAHMDVPVLGSLECKWNSEVQL